MKREPRDPGVTPWWKYQHEPEEFWILLWVVLGFVALIGLALLVGTLTLSW